MSNETMQALFDAIAARAKDEALGDSGMIGLGELHARLQGQKQDAPVVIEHGGALVRPGELESYRGYYEDLSFDLEAPFGKGQTVADVVKDIEQYLHGGESYTGYKGGDFYANPRTLVWASHYGNCDGTGVTGVSELDGTVIITTAKADD